MSDHLTRATIYDVAKRAGVSSATASRVLSGSDYPVSDAARKRILSAAAELNYKPNLIGQMLKKSVSNDIGIILPNISNPFYTELVLGAETAAKQRGFGLLLCNTLRSEIREKEYLESLCQKQVGGVILSSVTTDLLPLKRLIDQYRLKVIALDQSMPQLSGARVDFQIRRAAFDAVCYLNECGHHRIALLSSPARIYSRKEVRRGYREALAACNLPFDETLELIATTETELASGEIYEFENGRLLANKLLALPERPTAVLCVNDITAAGVLQQLSESNVNVPGDVSVMGLDNSSISRMVSPSLTTVDQSPFEAGMRVALSLIDAMTEDRAPHETIEITPRLVVRNSVRKLI